MNDYSTLAKKFWDLSSIESLNASSILMYLFILHKISSTEESRITEKYPWIKWAGLAVAGTLLLFLFVSVAKNTKSKI